MMFLFDGGIRARRGAPVTLSVMHPQGIGIIEPRARPGPQGPREGLVVQAAFPGVLRVRSLLGVTSSPQPVTRLCGQNCLRRRASRTRAAAFTLHLTLPPTSAPTGPPPFPGGGPLRGENRCQAHMRGPDTLTSTRPRGGGGP